MSALSPRSCRDLLHASTSPAFVSQPAEPWPRSSGMPPTSEARTGVPAASASMTIIGSPSNHNDGRTRHRTERSVSSTASCSTGPVNRTPGTRIASSASRSGPSPTTRSSQSRKPASRQAVQEPANAFLACQPPDVSELTRLRCGYCALVRVRDAIVAYAQLVFWYSRFDKTGLREFREAEEEVHVLRPRAQLPVDPGVGRGKSRCGEGVLVAAVQQAVER